MLCYDRLLEDRFKLRTHTENRDVPSYLLVLARADGRFGAQLKRTSTDCSDRQASVAPPDLPSPPTDQCGFLVGTRTAGSGFDAVRGAKGITMQQLAVQMAGPAGRPVVDRTGLLGSYDVDLRYSIGNNADSLSTPIFTALQEQLGLKLEPANASIEFVLIDSVERPSED